MRWITAKPKEPSWLYGTAGALMIAGPIWREMYLFYYPLRPEILGLPLVVGTIGAIIAVGSRLVGGLLGTLVFGALLFVFADLQFDLQRYTYTAAILATCVLVAALLVRHRAAITAMALGAFYASSLLRPASPLRITASAPVPSSGPVLVHVIFDEQWGIGGLRAVGDTATADFLTAFYLERGFEVFEGAYSRYEYTEQSIPIAFLLGQAPPEFNPDKPTQPGGPYWRSLQRNPYLERLRELGYDLRVYQSTYLDFCSGVDVPVAECDVQSSNSIGNIGFVGGSWITRGLWAARYFLSTRSHVYAKLTPSNAIWRRSGAHGGIAEMERLASVLAAGRQKSTAYLVHVLLPHRPVQLDAECRLLPDAANHIGYEYPTQPNDSLWRAAVLAYGGHVRCTHRMLGHVIDAVDSTVGRDNSIVNVHGDQGSRMRPRKIGREVLEEFTVIELNSIFSTLLAVRRPHVAAALHQYAVPVQDAIWEFARSGFADSLSRRWQHEVRSRPDSLGRESVRPLTTTDMSWARREN